MLHRPDSTDPLRKSVMSGAPIPTAEPQALAHWAERELGVHVDAVEPLLAGIGLRRFYRVTTSGDPSSLIARVEMPEDPAGRPTGSPPEPALEPPGARWTSVSHGFQGVPSR